MKLSYECGLDPKTMLSKGGKKFCEQCQKHVVDLRQKSSKKVAQFYTENPNACVIAFQDQLDKLPTRKSSQSAPRNYWPYATGIIVASMLPGLTLAQKRNLQNLHMEPGAISLLNEKKENPPKIDNKKVDEKFYLHGKLSMEGKKIKIKAGRVVRIVTYQETEDGEKVADTLGVGRVGLGGNFKIKLTKKAFDYISNDNNYFRVNIDGLRRERVVESTVSGNVINMEVMVRNRGRRVMGKF